MLFPCMSNQKIKPLSRICKSICSVDEKVNYANIRLVYFENIDHILS